MASFGKGLKRTGDTNGSDAPAFKLGKRTPVPLMELDFDKLEFGTRVETGKQGDKFVRCTYDGGARLEISLATLPNFCRAPFPAGPPKTADGTPLGTAYGLAVALTPEQHDKWAAFEALVVKKLQPLRNELFPADAAKRQGGMTEQAFADKYNTKLSPANAEKGYPPLLRMHIETDPERQTPKIQLMHLLEGNKCTRPKAGSISDLVARAAVVPVISLVRGVYAGKTGLGCKFAGTAIDVLTNLQLTSAPEMDYSGVEFVDEETPDSAPAASNGDGADEEEGAEGNGDAPLLG